MVDLQVLILGLSLCALCLVLLTIIRYLQRTIESQQQTIQKLLNREPVTYKETGQQPKKTRTVYSAWAGEEVDLNEEQN